MRRKTKRNLIILIILIIVGVIWFRPHHVARPPKTVAVKTGSVSETVLATGQIVPHHAVQVKSQIPGSVGKELVKEGDFVKAGQVLMLIQPTGTPQDIAQAIANVKTREAAFQRDKSIFSRDKTLLESGAVTQQTFESDRANVKTDHANLALAKQNLSLLLKGKAVINHKMVESNVVSPISGLVLNISVNQGDSITANTQYQSGTTLVVLADMRDLLFKGQVSQIDIGKLQLNQTADLQVAALPDLKLQGIISAISFQSTQAQVQQAAISGAQSLFSAPTDLQDGFAIQISGFALPKNAVLRAGYEATAEILVKKIDSVLVLPQMVLHYANGKPYVLLPAAKNKKPIRKFITIGASNAEVVQVKSGLKAGDLVIK